MLLLEELDVLLLVPPVTLLTALVTAFFSALPSCVKALVLEPLLVDLLELLRAAVEVVPPGVLVPALTVPVLFFVAEEPLLAVLDLETVGAALVTASTFGLAVAFALVTGSVT